MDYNKIKELLNQRKHKSPVPGETPRSGKTYNWFSFPGGVEKVTLRPLPGWEGAPMPGKFVYKHYSLPGKDAKLTCFQTNGMECPICSVLIKYQDRLDLNEWSAKERAYFNALFIKASDDNGNNIALADRGGKAYANNLPYIVNSSGFMFAWLLDCMVDPERGDITDPKTGHNIIIQRESPGGKFKRDISLKPTPLGESDEQIKELLSQIPNLDEIWRSPDDAYFKVAQTAASALENVIQNRLNEILPNQTQVPAAAPVQQSTPTVQTGQPVQISQTAPAQPAPVPQSTTPVQPSQTQTVQPPQADSGPKTKPGGAPDCFGDKDVYYFDKPDHPNAGKCQMCPFDLICAEEVKGA